MDHKPILLDTPLPTPRRAATPAHMGLRDQIKKKLQGVLNRLSGEYSAAADAVATPPDADSPASADTGTAGGDVKVTRARLRRPPGE